LGRVEQVERHAIALFQAQVGERARQAIARFAQLGKRDRAAVEHYGGALGRRGNWLIKGERIGNHALRDFISRNYACDERGRWYFQNGPQRVFVRLAYAPLVVHYEGSALLDHRGQPFTAGDALLDEEGSVLLPGNATVALLDDRDLEQFADRADSLARIAASVVPERFGFVRDPQP
jgi:hypothetical protein